MKCLTSDELRQMYLDFFKSKGHAVIKSASLIPENDPTVLFTTAGMHPLVPYLLGETHPAGTRLTDVQKCVRTGDIDVYKRQGYRCGLPGASLYRLDAAKLPKKKLRSGLDGVFLKKRISKVYF